jgi:branched-chain amino acid transport system permease protein
MTALKQKNTPAWLNALNNPTILYSIAIAYVVLTLIGLNAVERSNLWYQSYNLVIFSLLAVSPMVFISLPIPNWLKAVSVGVLIVVIMPLVGLGNLSYLDTAIQICIYACFALGLNIVVGYVGLLDLGYVAFFAIGAYLWGMFTSTAKTIFFESGATLPPDTILRIGDTALPFSAIVLFIVGGSALAAVVGILLGLPVLRLRGDYLAIVTLGFGEVFRILAQNLDKPVNITNGALGLNNVSQPPADFMLPTVNQFITWFNLRADKPETIAQNLLIYFIALAILLLAMIISYRLEHSPIGRAWTAIREDEVAAVAMGVPKLGMKLRAFAVGAAFGGAMGVLFSAKQQFISPESFRLVASIGILSMVIIGGIGGIKGAIFGALIIRLLELHILTSLNLQITALKNANFVVPIVNFPMGQLSPELDPTKFKPLIFGLILVLMMLFRPGGLLPAGRRRLELDDAKEAKAE